MRNWQKYTAKALFLLTSNIIFMMLSEIFMRRYQVRAPVLLHVASPKLWKRSCVSPIDVVIPHSLRCKILLTSKSQTGPILSNLKMNSLDRWVVSAGSCNYTASQDRMIGLSGRDMYWSTGIDRIPCSTCTSPLDPVLLRASDGLPSVPSTIYWNIR